MRLAALLICSLAAARALPAGENGASTGSPQARVTPVLVPDPAVMRIVNALGDGQGAALPRFKVAGDINAEAKRWRLEKHGPGYRDYCLKMAWMPERKRAIFFGANHGVPHRLNDVWEHDLPSNTWYCLYGPDKTKGKGKSDYDDLDWDLARKTGVIRTKRGGPGNPPHEWWQMAYDPGAKAMFTTCRFSTCHPEVTQLMRSGTHKPPLWAFYPEEKKWEPVTGSKFEGKRPVYRNASQMEYVPELGGIVWARTDGMWLYTSGTNTWKQLGDSRKYGKDLSGFTCVMAYLPDRKILVSHCRAGKGKPSTGYPESWTTHYEVANDRWKRVFHSREKNNPPPGMDSRTNFAYDPVGKVCLLWDPDWTRSLWAYDPEKVTWTKLEIKGEAPPTRGRDVKLAYYDAARNVFVINGQWVYRHKRRAAGK